jgi:hypothetical protein
MSLFIFTKDGTRYVFDDKPEGCACVHTLDLVNGDVDYCYPTRHYVGHPLEKFVVRGMGERDGQNSRRAN